MTTHSSMLAWEIHGQRSLVGYGPWCHKESDSREQLSMHVGGGCWGRQGTEPGKCQGWEGATWGPRLSPPPFLTLTGPCAHPADPTAVKLENFPIHAITGVLKQWLRELPEPLMTFAQYGDFLHAVGESPPLW